MNFNLGNVGSQLSLDEQNRAFQNVNTQGSGGYGPAPVAQIAAAAPQAAPIVAQNSPAQANAVGSGSPNGYIPASYTPIPQEPKKEKSGLESVLGIVGKVIAFL